MINGKRGWLWRAVDDASDVLDVLVQRRRSARAAKRFFRKLLKGLGMVPRALVTDRLASYAAANAVVMPTVSHHRGWRQNNRVENSGHRVGDDGGSLSRREVSSKGLSVVANLFDALPANGANNLTTTPTWGAGGRGLLRLAS